MGVGAEGNTGLGTLFDALARANAERRARTRAVLAAAGLEDVLSEAGQRAGRLAEDLLQASRANRKLVENLVIEEVARAADRWGFVRSEELEELRREVDELRVSLVKATLDGKGGRSGEGTQQGTEVPGAAPPKPARKRAPARSAAKASRQQHPLGGVAPEAVAPEPTRATVPPAEDTTPLDESTRQP